MLWLQTVQPCGAELEEEEKVEMEDDQI